MTSGTHFEVQTGTKLYAYFYARPSWTIAGGLYQGVCKSNIVCTANWLEDNYEFEGWGAAEFWDGIRDYADFWPAVQYVADKGYQELNETGNACLVLTKSLTMNLDWETRDWDRGYAPCRTGQWPAE